jgi:hypothetical protein
MSDRGSSGIRPFRPHYTPLTCAMPKKADWKNKAASVGGIDPACPNH